MGYVESKTMNENGSDLFKTLSPYRGHSFASIFINVYQNVTVGDISVRIERGSCWVKRRSLDQMSVRIERGSCWVKRRSLDQMSLKSCSPSKGHSFA